MEERYRMILTSEELGRIKHAENWCDITVDLHQLTVKQAQKLLNNLIVLNRQDFQIRAIHGYHRGTAIKEMILNGLSNPRISRIKAVKGNPGQTLLFLEKAA